MIGGLKGKVEIIQAGQILIWTNQDVAYLVNIPINLNLKEKEIIRLYIHTHVKEDSLSLYGFDNQEKLKLFKAFIQISGIGPKLALAILETYKVEEIKQAIQMGDVSFFTKVPGIGKKGGQKIILELSSVLKLEEEIKNQYDPKLIQALKSLGYKMNEIKPVLDNLKLNPQQPLNQSLKIVLKKLVKG